MLSPIMKAVGQSCNLRCKYCFYNGNQDQMLDVMNFETLRTITRKLLSVSGSNIHFIWHGGEPLLAGINFYKKAVELQNEYKSNNQNIRNGIQTNGTLLSTDWADFFKANNFGVGVSLDGPEFIHNRLRTYKSGEGSFQQTMRGINIMREQGIQVSCIAVITSNSVSYPEQIFNFFYNEGICFSASQCTADEYNKSISKDLAVDPFDYATFLLRLLDLWLETGDPNFKIGPIDDFIHAIMGQKPKSCIFNGHCEHFVTIDTNGDLYPCNHYRNEEHLWGNLLKSDYNMIIDNSNYSEYLLDYKKTLITCEGCKWIGVCRGWCRKTWGSRVIESNDKHPNCRAISALFEGITERLIQLGYEPNIK